MKLLDGVPVWVMLLVALACGGVFVARFWVLMVNPADRWAFAISAIYLAVPALLLPAVKHTSADEALALYADVTTGLWLGSVPFGRALRTAGLASEGKTLTLPGKTGWPFAAIIAVIVVGLILAEGYL